MIVLDKENQKIYTFNSDSKVAYDGCHKIYICEDEKEVKEAIEIGYEIHEISELEKLYNASCPLVSFQTGNYLSSMFHNVQKLNLSI